MSVRPRISVLRLRQLSIRRLYDRVEKERKLDLPGRGQKRREATAGARELPPGALGLSVADPPSGRREVTEPRHELALAEARRPLERPGGLAVLPAQQVTFDAPEDPLQAGVAGRPVHVRTRVVRHGDDRA